MTKYKEYFLRMLEENKSTFDNFSLLHKNYENDGEKYQEEFNSKGGKILDIVHEWEDRLCRSSEGAGYGVFTGKLAEKFREELKIHFPLIDHIGIVSVRSTFKIKKLL